MDEPWHFIDPKNITANDSLLTTITEHSFNLTEALRNKDMIRAGFESAWLAHAVTDGLTPAHHEPLEQQMEHLKSVGDKRNKVRGKLVMSGAGSKRQFVKNNWSYWGAKGLMTTHTLFEAGVATSAKPRSFIGAALTSEEVKCLNQLGFIDQYIEMLKEVDRLDMYHKFKQDGWTHSLAVETTQQLLPSIIKAVTMAWLEAYNNAQKKSV